MMGLRAVVVLAILTGRALADPAPPEMSPAEVTKWLTFFDKLVVVVVNTQSSTCDKMATDVSTVIDQNKAAVEVARSAHQAGKKLPKSAQQRMIEGVKKMVPGMQRCGTHDKVRAAFAKLDLSRKA